MDMVHSNAGAGSGGYYFFLSYARKPPGLDRDDAPTDLWVSTFYQDLCAQVDRLSRRRQRYEAGFMSDDQLIPAEEWTARVCAALGAAQVFVMLYSPAYFRQSWALGEWKAFRARTAALDVSQARRHIQPVLWVPFDPGEQTPGLDDARALAANIPEYGRNGMLAMCRLTTFRKQYAAVLGTLARRIVTVAETTPMARSPVSITVSQPVSERASFMIGVIAPTAAALAERHPTPGDLGSQWHPFAASHSLPAKQYAADVVNRLGVATVTVDLLADHDVPAGNAGIVLIDPWILEVPGGRNRLLSVVKSLPEWVVLFVLADRGDPRHGEESDALLAEVVELLSGHQYVVKYARRAADFAQLMPFVVTQARRRFLSRAPMVRADGAGSAAPGRQTLPRLGDHRISANIDE